MSRVSEHIATPLAKLRRNRLISSINKHPKPLRPRPPLRQHLPLPRRLGKRKINPPPLDRDGAAVDIRGGDVVEEEGGETGTARGGGGPDSLDAEEGWEGGGTDGAKEGTKGRGGKVSTAQKEEEKGGDARAKDRALVFSEPQQISRRLDVLVLLLLSRVARSRNDGESDLDTLYDGGGADLALRGDEEEDLALGELRGSEGC